MKEKFLIAAASIILSCGPNNIPQRRESDGIVLTWATNSIAPVVVSRITIEDNWITVQFTDGTSIQGPATRSSRNVPVIFDREAILGQPLSKQPVQ